MAGLKIKNMLIYSSLFYLFAFFFFLFAYQQEDCLELFEVLFLDFELFPQYMFDKFSITLFVLNYLMFFLFHHPQVSNLLENTSFLSLGSHKRTKKRLIINILLDALAVNGFYLIFSFVEICLIGIVGNLMIQKKIIIDFTLCLKLFIFLMKYYSWHFIFVSAMQLTALIHPLSHEEMVPYIVFSVGLMIDFSLDTHWITLAGNAWSGLLYTVIVMVIGVIVDGYAIYKINHSKEIFV